METIEAKRRFHEAVVLLFGGFSSGEKIAKHTQLLPQALKENNIQTKDHFYAWATMPLGI